MLDTGCRIKDAGYWKDEKGILLKDPASLSDDLQMNIFKTSSRLLQGRPDQNLEGALWQVKGHDSSLFKPYLIVYFWRK